MKRPAARTTGMLAVSILIAVFAVAPVAFADTKVTLCHRTDAVANPYVEQTVDQSSIMKLAQGNEEAGHGWHQGPVFTTSMTNVDVWGDIIPAFGDYPGLNWPAGEAWIKNGCMTPPPPTRVVLPTLKAASGTCTEFGSVNATNTAFYTWASSGSVDATYYTATKIGNVVLVGDNPQGPFNLSKLTGGQCARSVTLPTLTPTPGTCTEFGSVNATNTAFYTWASSGSVDATYYTATKIGNVVLVGDNPQGPFNLSKLDPASAECSTPYRDVNLPTLKWTPGTCTEFGTVNNADTADYAWATSVTGEGTSYTASPIGNVNLVGDRLQGPFDLSKLASQSTNSGGRCYVPPVIPVVPTVPGDPTVQPKITLKAAVVNDAGGTAQVSDFTLTGSSIQVASAAALQNSAAMARPRQRPRRSAASLVPLRSPTLLFRSGPTPCQSRRCLWGTRLRPGRAPGASSTAPLSR